MPPMQASEIKTLIRDLWRTTFRLDDGTHLKTIPFAWGEFSATNQDIAISELRQLCISELKKAGLRYRLHLEFSEMPRTLEDMLTDLAGEDNPDFTWGKIPPSSADDP